MDNPKSADDYQIGGNHYKSEYDHWNLVLVVPLSYLEGCSTKYVVRWRTKGSAVSDLRKSLHYLNKLDEDGSLQLRQMTHQEILGEVLRFSQANNLNDLERRYVEVLSTWTDKTELHEARLILFQLLDEAQGLVPGASPVPLTEENHHAPRAGDETGW